MAVVKALLLPHTNFEELPPLPITKVRYEYRCCFSVFKMGTKCKNYIESVYTGRYQVIGLGS